MQIKLFLLSLLPFLFVVRFNFVSSASAKQIIHELKIRNLLNQEILQSFHSLQTVSIIFYHTEVNCFFIYFANRREVVFLSELIIAIVSLIQKVTIKFPCCRFHMNHQTYSNV